MKERLCAWPSRPLLRPARPSLPCLHACEVEWLYVTSLALQGQIPSTRKDQTPAGDMSRRMSRPFGTAPADPTARLPGRVAAAVLLVSALATACGQFASAQRSMLATKPSANQSLTPSPN